MTAVGEPTPGLLAAITRYPSGPAVGVAAVPAEPLVSRPSQETVDLVRNSYTAITGNPGELLGEFHRHLLALAPECPPGWCGELASALGGLDSIETTEEHLRQIGTAHHGLPGATPEHYVAVSHALLRAVRCLTVGSAPWAADLSSAWVEVLEWASWHMQSAARRI